MSLIGELSLDGDGPQTLAELGSRNKILIQQLKSAMDSIDEKNKRIQELDNKCLEYENLLTTHGEKAFENFDRKLEEFKTHHVWTVKQVCLLYTSPSPRDRG